MSTNEILIFLGKLGGRYTPESVLLAQNYFQHMIKDGRIIAIYKDGGIHGILAFSLCTEYTPYWKKKTWDYVEQEINGTTLYIEILAALNWTKELRQIFEQEILARHPHIDQAVWHRWASWGDRKVTWRKACLMK